MSKKPSNEKKQCLKCQKDKVTKRDFYLSNSQNHADSRYPICKTCIKENLKSLDEAPTSSHAIESIQNVLLEMNRPFLLSLYMSSVEESQRTGKDLFGMYLKNTILNFKDYTWKDSEFEDNSVKVEKETDKRRISIKVQKQDFAVTDQIINKWGYGYLPEEYKAFEHKYSMLKNNYQEKTAMHTEALLTYIRYRVKEELATAKNDMKSAKDWGQLAQKAAQDAKINPSQLSKSDLSDGLDTFGQLVRSVEQAVDIIPILPQFKDRSQDKVDFTIWCYINYIRDLKGLPLADYNDIYRFYEERKKEYEDRDEG